MIKVLIGTPVKETLPVGYVKSLTDMISQNKDIEFEVQLEYGALYDARDRICDHAIHGGFDYLLFIDSDETFAPDLVTRLMSHEKNIVTGVYVDKHKNHKPLLFTELHPEDNDMPPSASRKNLDLSESLIEVAGCGAGALLVSNHALRLIKIHQHDWFKPFKGLGEDVSFCYRATTKPLGFKIYCDTKARLGHLKTIEYTVDDWSGVCDE